jgi:hypothetical protein
MKEKILDSIEVIKFYIERDKIKEANMVILELQKNIKNYERTRNTKPRQ